MNGTQQNGFDILETVCVTDPRGQHFLILQARNRQTGEMVWAVGDDQVCAVTRADFLRNRDIPYQDVLIKEFPYSENSPDSVGEWKPLIEELVRHTLQKYLQHDGMVHVYPQWLPQDVKLPAARETLLKDADHVILYPDNTLEVVPQDRIQGGMQL